MKRVMAVAAAAIGLGGAWPAAAHPGHEPVPAGRQDRAMGDAAGRFLATLTPTQRATVARPFDDAKARVNWSNLPTFMAPREGLAVNALSDAQRIALHGLLVEGLSSQGYEKVKSIMWAEEILRESRIARFREEPAADAAAAARRDDFVRTGNVGNYWIVVFGEPDAGRWGWMLSGHHLAINITVTDGKVAFTPLFKGVEPQTVESGQYAGWRILEHEISRGFDLIATLNATQRAAAIQGEAIGPELFTGKGRKDSLKAPVGLQASALTPSQQTLLWRLLDEYVGDAGDPAAAAQLAKVKADGLGALRFAWWGSVDDRSKRFMYRVHGPSILIEYVREPARGGAPGNHVHAIVRDPSNDYGEDWLGRHYDESLHG